MQQYGEMDMTEELAKKIMDEDAEQALVATKAREEMRLVVSELERFRLMLEEVDPKNRPTEMTKFGPHPMCDKTRMQLVLQFAQAISRLRIDDLRLDEKNYLHVDELTRRIPMMMSLIHRCFARLEEMVIDKVLNGKEHDGKTPQDVVKATLQEGMREIWLTAKTGRQKGGSE